jgi:hypothetical protein
MKNLASLLAVLFAAGCASYSGRGLEAGVSTEAQVRGLMGTPAAEYAGPGGSRNLAYPHGPLGIETFMAEVGPDGRLVAVRQVLNEENFRGISRGMTRDEVLLRIGPPGETMEFPNLKQVAWDYRFRDLWGYTAIFSVSLDRAGLVVSTFTRRIDLGRRGND